MILLRLERLLMLTNPSIARTVAFLSALVIGIGRLIVFLALAATIFLELPVTNDTKMLFIAYTGIVFMMSCVQMLP